MSCNLRLSLKIWLQNYLKVHGIITEYYVKSHLKGMLHRHLKSIFCNYLKLYLIKSPGKAVKSFT